MTTRIGMITPSSNTCVEPCTYALVAGILDTTVHFARTPVTRIALDDSANHQFDTAPMVAAAELLADAHVDSIVWNGTSGSWLGLDHDRALCTAITARTGIAATTSSLAILDACHALDATHIGLVTPYTGDVVDAIRTEYARHGIDIVAETHSGLTDNHAFADLTPNEVTAMVRSVASHADAVVILCTNVDGTDTTALEPDLGIPVIDSILASAWAGLRLVDDTVRLRGHGTLFDSGSLRATLQHTIDDLRQATGSDRTTLRIDLPALGLTVQTATAESCGDGIAPIRTETSLPQRRLNTVEWLEANRKPLIQNDFQLPPEPPQALRDVYGVAAQMLSPIEISTDMTGWISVHSVTECTWTLDDIAALETATHTVADLLRDDATTRSGRPAIQ